MKTTHFILNKLEECSIEERAYMDKKIRAYNISLFLKLPEQEIENLFDHWLMNLDKKDGK